MLLYFNLSIYILLFSFFSLSIFGYGYYLREIISNNKSKTIGESGLYGFISLYILSVVFHFFFHLNIYFTISILIFGSLLSIRILRKNISLEKYKLKLILPFFLLILLLGASNNPHDDVYLYQLPYISYLQNQKLVFGLVNLNEFTAYSNSFYDIMGLFKTPVLGNQTVYLIPTIFFMFFIIFLIENYNESSKIIKIFIYSIVILAFLRFTRSKEFGTDVPVICILFLIQFYILKFLENKEHEIINKILILLTFAFFLKAYAALAAIYLFVFLKDSKKIFKDNHNLKKTILLMSIIIVISSTKNIAHSGCISYPIKISCFDKNVITWSNGHDIVELRNKGLTAGAKGIKPYIRNNRKDENITAEEYLNKFKYSYHLNVVKDPDFKRLLVVFLIMFIFLFLAFLSKIRSNETYSNNFNTNKLNSINLIILILPTILWWILIPISKYGGYSYLLFGIFLSCIYFNLFKYSNLKNLRIFLIISLIFFLGRNINRVIDEYNSDKYSNKNYPLPVYKYHEYKNEKINNQVFYVTNNLNRCGDIKFPCLERPHFDAIKSIKKIKGYLFIEGIKEKQIESIKIEQKWAYNTNNN